jgi:hypothetical protein
VVCVSFAGGGKVSGNDEVALHSCQSLSWHYYLLPFSYCGSRRNLARTTIYSCLTIFCCCVGLCPHRWLLIGPPRHSCQPPTRPLRHSHIPTGTIQGGTPSNNNAQCHRHRRGARALLRPSRTPRVISSGWRCGLAGRLYRARGRGSQSRPGGDAIAAWRGEYMTMRSGQPLLKWDI